MYLNFVYEKHIEWCGIKAFFLGGRGGGLNIETEFETGKAWYYILIGFVMCFLGLRGPPTHHSTAQHELFC